jgi:RNA polymerase sigma-70 factor (ECF subfamily)
MASDEGLRPLEAYRSYLKVLARTHLPPGFGRHFDESDVVQTTLAEAHRDRAHFRGRTEGEFMAWLRRSLARNLTDAVKRLRRRKRDIARDASLRDLVDRSAARLEHWCADENASTPSFRARRQERIVALTDAIERLPAAQREAVILRHLHGLGLEEIARLMERSTSSVASLLHRGVTSLRARAGDDEAS